MTVGRLPTPDTKSTFIRYLDAFSVIRETHIFLAIFVRSRRRKQQTNSLYEVARKSDSIIHRFNMTSGNFSVKRFVSIKNRQTNFLKVLKYSYHYIVM